VSVRFFPAGDTAAVIELGDEISLEVNARVRALEHLIGQGALPAVIETVPSFRSLLVYYDPRLSSYDALCKTIAMLVPEATATVLPPARRVELPCCYEDAELGFELAAAADCLGLSVEALVRLHSAAQYHVYFLGFAPGQPYMTGMPDRLTIPRLTTPRTKTPPGSVGIGGTQCCVYSVASPGGFWVLGRTPLGLYDPAAESPILLHPGDSVRFRSIDRSEYDRISEQVKARTYRPVIA
jgi:inhibitor of KinA